MGLNDGILVVVSVLEGKFALLSTLPSRESQQAKGHVKCNLQHTSDSPSSFP